MANSLDTHKKKILFIVEAMGGGIFTYIYNLANELSKSSEVFVAYAVRPQTPTNYKDYFDKSVNLIEVKNFTRSINIIQDIRSMNELVKIKRSICPDIIHLHSSKAGVLGRIVFCGKTNRLFYTPHGYSFLMENYSQYKRVFFWFIEWLCARKNCTTISCSRGEHLETLKLTKRAICISNGINIEELEDHIQKTSYKNHPITVFTMGRICFQKNPELFNDIAKSMPDIRFMWIGDGELKELLSSNNIEITGWLDRKRVLEKCVNADIFILTSRWEGLPISLLEAMYMEKLCVVSDVIGNNDVIKNGINGFVCKEASEFRDAILKDCKEIRKRARTDTVLLYNSKKMCREYLSAYEKQ